MPSLTLRRKVAPPEVARRYGVSVYKVHAWIASGELRATNLATRPGGKPRWKIDEADLAAFEAGRANTPVPEPQRRRRRKADASVTEYF
ncbi:MAG: helix-turn-helix domain-containing protein [Planctomycetota bacterium]